MTSVLYWDYDHNGHRVLKRAAVVSTSGMGILLRDETGYKFRINKAHIHKWV